MSPRLRVAGATSVHQWRSALDPDAPERVGAGELLEEAPKLGEIATRRQLQNQPDPRFRGGFLTAHLTDGGAGTRKRSALSHFATWNPQIGYLPLAHSWAESERIR